jgi:hypothetical protein
LRPITALPFSWPVRLLRSNDVDDDEPGGGLPTELERLIAATFALMTAWYQCPQPAICHKVLENLTLIGRHASVSPGMGRVCANAAARWAACLEEVELAIEEVGDDEDEAQEDDDGSTTIGSEPAAGPITLH